MGVPTLPQHARNSFARAHKQKKRKQKRQGAPPKASATPPVPQAPQWGVIIVHHSCPTITIMHIDMHTDKYCSHCAGEQSPPCVSPTHSPLYTYSSSSSSLHITPTSPTPPLTPAPQIYSSTVSTGAPPSLLTWGLGCVTAKNPLTEEVRRWCRSSVMSVRST